VTHAYLLRDVTNSEMRDMALSYKRDMIYLHICVSSFVFVVSLIVVAVLIYKLLQYSYLWNYSIFVFVTPHTVVAVLKFVAFLISVLAALHSYLWRYSCAHISGVPHSFAHTCGVTHSYVPAEMATHSFLYHMFLHAMQNNGSVAASTVLFVLKHICVL